MSTAWGTNADDQSARIDTDMYGSVTREVHDFLRDRAVTPAEWSELVSHFGTQGHDQACTWVSKYQTDAGRYDSYRAERALDRLSGRQN